MHERGAGSSRSPQFSGVASGDNARLHPWQSSPSKCGNDEAGNVPQHVPKHEPKAGRVTKVNVNTRPGEHKTNQTTSACNASVGKEMLGFSPGSGSGS